VQLSLMPFWWIFGLFGGVVFLIGGSLCFADNNAFIVYTVYTSIICIMRMYRLTEEKPKMPKPHTQKQNKFTHKIADKHELAPKTILLRIHAPEIAAKAKPGQFVMVMTDEKSERMPLTLVDWDTSIGEISIIFQQIGHSTLKFGRLAVGDKLFTVTGPLGNPSDIKNYGNVAVVCGGVGTAAAYPIARALKKAGNKVTSIIGARTQDLLILQNEMKHVSDQFYISTDDGSKGQKGFVCDVLKVLLLQERFDVVFAVGPTVMMSATAEVTRPYRIKTIASLNSIMVCGIGLCGACRVSVNNVTRFSCIEGPEFDAHQVNFKELIQRLRSYSNEEKLAMQFHEKHGDFCDCQKTAQTELVTCSNVNRAPKKQ
jgi:ferredoxin/flavodoxin---NADP+ reductase